MKGKPKFKIGDRVKFQYGTKDMSGTILTKGQSTEGDPNRYVYRIKPDGWQAHTILMYEHHIQFEK